ncbi:hypothetical protein Godav_011876, partial [Gossypium davidsonii]|nr:hypothetical protein [Gossypium davidsonii]
WKLKGATDLVVPTPIRNTSLSEIGRTNTTFRRLNLKEESNPETQTTNFRTARAFVFSIPTTFRTPQI